MAKGKTINECCTRNGQYQSPQKETNCCRLLHQNKKSRSCPTCYYQDKSQIHNCQHQSKIHETVQEVAEIDIHNVYLWLIEGCGCLRCAQIYLFNLTLSLSIWSGTLGIRLQNCFLHFCFHISVHAMT